MRLIVHISSLPEGTHFPFLSLNNAPIPNELFPLAHLYYGPFLGNFHCLLRVEFQLLQGVSHVSRGAIIVHLGQFYDCLLRFT